MKPHFFIFRLKLKFFITKSKLKHIMSIYSKGRDEDEN